MRSALYITLTLLMTLATYLFLSLWSDISNLTGGFDLDIPAYITAEGTDAMNRNLLLLFLCSLAIVICFVWLLALKPRPRIYVQDVPRR